MTPTELWAVIQATPSCAAHIVLSEPKVDAGIARAGDQAIADILNALPTMRVLKAEREITKRGVRNALDVVPAATFLKLLKELGEAQTIPAEFAAVLTAMGVPEADHWAYLDTLQEAWDSLQTGGAIDLVKPRTLAMLQLIKAARPDVATACDALTADAYEEPAITAEQVSRAVRGPRE